MPWPEEARFKKTAKGVVEIRDRLQGIATRSRQVLILVNGRRSVAELSQLIPGPDLFAQLQMLEAQAFITRVSTQEEVKPNSWISPTTRSDPLTKASPPTKAGPATLIHSLWSDTRLRADSVMAEDATPATPNTAAPGARYDPIQELCDRVIRNLLDTIGPAGDLMAERIARCTSVQELRDLMPAVSSIVEALRGRDAAREFVLRATKKR